MQKQESYLPCKAHLKPLTIREHFEPIKCEATIKFILSSPHKTAFGRKKNSRVIYNPITCMYHCRPRPFKLSEKSSRSIKVKYH